MVGDKNKQILRIAEKNHISVYKEKLFFKENLSYRNSRTFVKVSGK